MLEDDVDITEDTSCNIFFKIRNSWSRRQLTMITAAFLLAAVITDAIRLHSARLSSLRPWPLLTVAKWCQLP